MAKRKITLELLAAMMKRGFDELRTEFTGEFGLVHKEIGGLRTEMHKGFQEVYERLDVQGEAITGLNHRVKRLEKFTGIDK